MEIRDNLVYLLVCFSVCLTGILGCNQFELGENALISPATGDINAFSNFQARELASKTFEWSRGQSELCLNIPEAGEYLLTYITGQEGNSLLMTSPATQPHSFAIAFRASAPAYISIGLHEGDSLEHFTLQRGTIKHEAVGLYDDGPIIRYASPSIPTIFWKDVFTLASDEPPIVLERGVLTCPPPSSPIQEWR